MRYLSTAHIRLIHDSVILPHELQGEAADKSVDSVVARVENRMSYGLVHDVFDLAAAYAAAISIAHAFNDANKRTAFAAMDTVLALNGIELPYHAEEAGNMIRKLVLGHIDEKDLAGWLIQLSAQ